MSVYKLYQVVRLEPVSTCLVVAVSEAQAERKMSYDTECFKCDDMVIGMSTPEFHAVEIDDFVAKAVVARKFPKEMERVKG